MPKLTASAQSIIRLQKLINDFFYSSSYVIDPDNLAVKNNKGPVSWITVKKRKNRFLAYLN